MKHKLFSLEYLSNEELTEDDLFLLFETNSLNYSLIVAMYRYCGIYTHENKIISDIKKDNSWINFHHFKNDKDRSSFTNIVKNVVKNVYTYSDYVAQRWADDWMLHYGFSIYHCHKKYKYSKN